MLGTLDPDSVPERWEGADVLFLDQAIVQIALNLLPEAAANLHRAAALFERSGQRYELGQALYYRALIALRNQAFADAAAWLTQAAALFRALDNHYWLRCVHQAEATGLLWMDDAIGAAKILDSLLTAGADTSRTASTGDWITRIEEALLRSRIAVALDDGAARRWRRQ